MAKVIDAPCGKGKTSWAIQFMNESKEKKFIFITPFLDEVDRIKFECADRNFKAPNCLKGKTKSADLKNLLVRGENIVASHALFSGLDNETIELIRMGGYTLILDEVMEVVKQESIKKDDLKIMIDQGLIEVLEDGTVIAPDPDNYNGVFKEIMMNAKMDRLIYVDGKMLLWQFPVDIFDAFEEVYNLTYLFDGQIQKYYYDLHDVDYSYHSVTKDADGRYSLVDFDPDGDREFKEILNGLMDIYDGDLNSIGKDKYALSVSWYGKYGKDNILKKIQKSMYNYFRNVVDSKSSENMWTCFKAQEKALKGNGYARGFVPHNARATNKYRDKSNLVYLVNRFPRTPIVKYFELKGIRINENLYALSELIQWIWRSQIRDGKPINLWIPSSRMRGLLEGWKARQ